MNPKKLKAKLSLGKEKIKTMDDSELKEIQGGEAAATLLCLTKYTCITHNCSWVCDDIPTLRGEDACYG